MVTKSEALSASKRNDSCRERESDDRNHASEVRCIRAEFAPFVENCQHEAGAYRTSAAPRRSAAIPTGMHLKSSPDDVLTRPYRTVPSTHGSISIAASVRRARRLALMPALALIPVVIPGCGESGSAPPIGETGAVDNNGNPTTPNPVTSPTPLDPGPVVSPTPDDSNPNLPAPDSTDSSEPSPPTETPDPDTTTDPTPSPALPTGDCDLVCDDFEGAEFDLAKWDFLGRNENNPQMTPVLDTSKQHSGSQSVMIPGGLTRGIGFYPLAGLPTANNKVYVRAYLLFDTPTDQLMGHSAVIIAADAPDNGGEVRLGFSQPPAGDSVMIDVNIQNVQGIGGEITQFSNGYVTGYEPLAEPGMTLGAETWYCFEVLFNGEDHELQLWIDGNEVSNMHVTDWSPSGEETKLPKPDWSPTYNTVRFGPQNYSGSPGQVWFDDIAISTQRVGCDAP